MTPIGLEYATSIGLPMLDVRLLAVNVIRTALGFAGFILVLKILHGGFIYMTHGGNEERRAEAIGIIKNGIIGMVIVGSSGSLAKFIIDAVVNATDAYL